MSNISGLVASLDATKGYGSLHLTISPAWISRVKHNIHSYKSYHYLFEQKTAYQHSPFDGIHFSTNHIVSAAFLTLAQQVGKQSYLPINSVYRECYSFGCVRVCISPRFTNARCTKIIINPSEGGLTLQQVVNWIEFIVGGINDVFVKRIDSKIDLSGNYSRWYIERVWWPHFRVSRFYKGKTLYLGSSKSKNQLTIYDKGLQMKLKTSLTRIEFREKLDKTNEMGVKDFMTNIHKMNPFNDVIIVKVDNRSLENLLRRYRSRVIDGIIYRSFKALKSPQKKSIVKRLISMDGVIYCSKIYEQELLSWMKMQ